MQKYNKYKIQYGEDQQRIKSFQNLYRRSLQDKVNDKNEYLSLCNIFTEYVDATKIESFL